MVRIDWVYCLAVGGIGGGLTSDHIHMRELKIIDMGKSSPIIVIT